MNQPSQEQIIKFCHDNIITDTLEMEVVPTNDGGIRLELAVAEKHTNLHSTAHGGVLTTMIDTAMGAACMARNKRVVTVSMTIDFMHAVPINTRIMTDAKILHDGRETVTCECCIVDCEGKIYAKGLAVFFVIGDFV